MIDLEMELFSKIKETLPEGTNLSNLYEATPAVLPTISFLMSDNRVYEEAESSSGEEEAALLTFSVIGYCERTQEKKEICKGLIALCNTVMHSAGFRRTMMQPEEPKEESASIYKIMAKYEAVVDKNHIIYRR